MRALAARLRSGWLVLAGSGAAASASLALLVLMTVFVAAAGARTAATAPGRTDWSGLTTGYSVVTAGGHRAYDGPTPPQLEFVYRDVLGQYARRVAGKLPVTGSRSRHGVLLQVAVTAATARRFTLAVGSRLRLDPDLTLVVTGIIRPTDGSSAFWAIDSVAAAPTHAMPRNGTLYWHGAVLPQWAAGGEAQPPNLMLITGPRLDGQRLAAVARRVVPGATVRLRSAALAALARAPLPHGADVAYAGGAVVAAGFGIVVLLIALLRPLERSHIGECRERDSNPHALSGRCF